MMLTGTPSSPAGIEPSSTIPERAFAHLRELAGHGQLTLDTVRGWQRSDVVPPGELAGAH
jgi:hypothetical protein